MVTDKGAFTLYADDIQAVDANSREWRELPGDGSYWFLSRGSTNYLELTETGLSIAGYPRQLRISGLQLPDLLTSDSDECDIDPNFVIAYTLGILLIAHAKSNQLDIDGRIEKSKYWMGIAEKFRPRLRHNIERNTRWLNG
jgi:hypothetical protein